MSEVDESKDNVVLYMHVCTQREKWQFKAYLLSEKLKFKDFNYFFIEVTFIIATIYCVMWSMLRNRESFLPSKGWYSSWKHKALPQETGHLESAY